MREKIQFVNEFLFFDETPRHVNNFTLSIYWGLPLHFTIRSDLLGNQNKKQPRPPPSLYEINRNMKII